jgi:hypothetical protein
MPADLIVVIPTSMPRDWTWIEIIEDELLLRGVLARVAEKTKWHRIDRDLIYDILTWRCLEGGESKCPAIVFEGEKAYLLKLDYNAEKYVEVYDLEEVLAEEIKGIIRYSECIARHGYDYC